MYAERLREDRLADCIRGLWGGILPESTRDAHIRWWLSLLYSGNCLPEDPVYVVGDTCRRHLTDYETPRAILAGGEIIEVTDAAVAYANGCFTRALEYHQLRKLNI